MGIRLKSGKMKTIMNIFLLLGCGLVHSKQKTNGPLKDIDIGKNENEKSNGLKPYEKRVQVRAPRPNMYDLEEVEIIQAKIVIDQLRKDHEAYECLVEVYGNESEVFKGDDWMYPLIGCPDMMTHKIETIYATEGLSAKFWYKYRRVSDMCFETYRNYVFNDQKYEEAVSKCGMWEFM